MIYWAPLLHFYQPPTQLHWVLDKVCDESYRPLIKIFRSNPSAKVTVNVTACLTELLAEHGKKDVIEGLSELAQKGQLEFTNSAKHHPILPLIPPDEVVRQITQNDETNRHFFGSVYAPKGFFPPEMCYSRDIVEPILKAKCEWVILSGVACPLEWPIDIVHYITAPSGKLSVFFRDDILSNMISFRHIDALSFLKHLSRLRGEREDIYVITAMDAETFGHHIKSWEKLFLAEVYEALNDNPPALIHEGVLHLRTLIDRQRTALSLQTEVDEIRAVTITELVRLFRQGTSVEPKPSSWSTSGEDIKVGNIYPLWNDLNNRIHQLLWEHLNITIDIVKKAVEAPDNETSADHSELARGLLDRAFHSDPFWWASKKPNWDINLINRGLMAQHEALLNGYKAIMTRNSLSIHDKREYRYLVIAARDLRARIREELFGS